MYEISERLGYAVGRSSRHRHKDNMSSDATLDRYRKLWSVEGGGQVVSICAEPTYRQNPDLQQMVSMAVECVRKDIAWGENAVPTFLPDFGTVSLAAMWGGKRIPASNGGGVHIEPVATSLDELERLAAPVSFEESDFAVALALYRQVCDRLQREDIFLRTPDLQGPMNTLGLLFDQSQLLMGLYESPQLIHHVLSHITDVTIDYLRRYRVAVGADRVIGNIWPWVILPDGRGISITQDFMPLLSPDLYAEFELPLLKRFADEFDGVFIHCCGAYVHHLPTLARADFKILGIEVHYPCTKLWDVYAALGQSLTYVPYVAPTGLNEFPSIVDFLKSLDRQPCRDANLAVCVAREWLTPAQCDDLHQWAQARSRTPNYTPNS